VKACDDAGVDEPTKSRLAHNEAIFRSINQQVLALEQRFGSAEGGFVCECADAGCAETTFLRLDEYQRIHSHDRRFFVVPRHEQPEIETVVEHHPKYLVVEKKVAVPEI
jgi:hypothetical protein